MAHQTLKIYTKTGDKGETSLVGGKRVSKADLRLNSYGTIDELNSVLGIVISQIRSDKSFNSKKNQTANQTLVQCLELLSKVQSSLFDIGSHLACENEKLALKLPKIRTDQISSMESWIDQANTQLKELKNFILPGGSLAASYTHLARTVARRSERIVVALAKKASVDESVVIYLNRLSDFLFVVSRFLNHLQKIEDVLWKPQKNL
jgi:cob(I)alamin adenosyltransferase